MTHTSYQSLLQIRRERRRKAIQRAVSVAFMLLSALLFILVAFLSLGTIGGLIAVGLTLLIGGFYLYPDDD